MGSSDKGQVPPPLPVKGSTADYGNLLDNQDPTTPSTPPPPPPHQRVGVLIRDEELLNGAALLMKQESDIHTLDIQVSPLLFLPPPLPPPRAADVVAPQSHLISPF